MADHLSPTFRTPALSPVSLGLWPASLAFDLPADLSALSAALPHQRQPAWLGLQSVFNHRLVSNHYPTVKNRFLGLPEAFLAGYE